MKKQKDTQQCIVIFCGSLDYNLEDSVKAPSEVAATHDWNESATNVCRAMSWL